MTSSLHGMLVPKTADDWREAFAFLYPASGVS
jgi:hypothetical protein